MSCKIDRRDFFILAGSSVAGLGAFSQGGLPPQDSGTVSDTPRVLALFSYNGGIYYYNPAGLHVEVGVPVIRFLGRM